jgi:prepilin-type N-terminal cleavage/methylation domain-containing protein
MSEFRKKLSESAGFTLVELIVVIAVLGILAGIAIPRLTGVTDKADIAAGESSLSTIRNYANMYFAEYGSSTSADLITIVQEYTDHTSVSGILSDGWSISDSETSISTNSTITIDNGTLNLKLELETGEITDTSSD